MKASILSAASVLGVSVIGARLERDTICQSIEILSPSGKRTVRVLIDSGAELNFIL